MIRIAAITFAGDSVITFARFRSSKIRWWTEQGCELASRDKKATMAQSHEQRCQRTRQKEKTDLGDPRKVSESPLCAYDVCATLEKHCCSRSESITESILERTGPILLRSFYWNH